MTQDAVDELCELLDLEPIEVNIFRGVSPKEDRQRVFGGQVAGQALVAAGRTVAQGAVHSLHAYFLRPGDPNIPILYDVDRIRDGKSFTTRRVVGIQHGRAIFNLQASFQSPEVGLDFTEFHKRFAFRIEKVEQIVVREFPRGDITHQREQIDTIRVELDFEARRTTVAFEGGRAWEAGDRDRSPARGSWPAG